MFKKSHPYPHTYSDNIIEDKLLNEIKKNWPEQIDSKWDEGNDMRVFRFESNESWGELDKIKKEFWREFIDNNVKDIIKKKFFVYEKFISKKFKKKLNEVYIPAMGLTEFGKHPIMINDKAPHSHFNEGVWLFTILIHIEDKIPENSNYTRGNTMFSLSNDWKEKNINSLAIELSKYKSAKPNMNLFDVSPETIPFKEGRVYSFLETCLSYHGFDDATRENSKNNAGKRKMIRIHVSAPDDYVKELYKLDKLNFRSLVDEKLMSDNLINLYKEDLNRINEFEFENQNVKENIINNLEVKGIHNHKISPFWTLENNHEIAPFSTSRYHIYFKKLKKRLKFTLN